MRTLGPRLDAAGGPRNRHSRKRHIRRGPAAVFEAMK
jgi:hypothetical protein